MIRFLGSFVLALLAFSSFAQKGTVSGTITAPEAGKVQPMPFVNVVIKGTATGGTTDLDGKFSFQAEPGNHTLVVSFVGFEPMERAVTVVAGGTAQVNIELKSQAIEMKAVDVVATRRTDTETAVIMETRQSMQVVSAISSETISKSQDSDASEVMKRVPGITLFGNSYVMIRGLSERYSNVQLHDVSAPSMEPDVRSFAFDIIPAGLIDRLVVYKSPAAELPGEFSGGVVKVYTKSIPNQSFFSVSMNTTFRQGSSLREFNQPKRSFLHSLGLNDGYNDLPDGFPTDVRTVSNSNDLGAINDVGRSLRNNWLPEQVNSMLDRSVSITNAAKFKLWGKEAGNITAINYTNAREIFDVTRADYNAYDQINDRSFPLYEFNDQQFNQRIRTGIISNFAVRLSPNSTIEFKNLFTVFNMTQYVNRTGLDYESGYVPDNHSFDQVYRGIYSGQLTGTHLWNEDRTKLTWTGGYGWSYRDQPDFRRYRSDVDTLTGGSTLFVGIPLSPNFLGRFYSEMRENTQSVNVALEHQLSEAHNFAPKLRTGLYAERRSRSFNARNMGYIRSNFLGFDEGLLNVTIDSLFAPTNINQTSGIRIGEQSNPSDSYTASNILMAYYVGADLPLIKDKLTMNTGVRAEYNMQRLESALLTGEPVIVDNPILSILPSANFAYNITKKQQLRLSYGRTVNRPEFRELAPFGFYDFNYNLVKKGSDSLRTPTIDNYDLRWEYYPSTNEMISVAFFHKEFKDPIETLFVPGGGSGGIKTFTFGNARFARSTGIEVEMRKSLMNMTTNPVLQRFSVLFNASLIDSEVDLGNERLGQSNQRPLQGQSPYIVNAGIYYQDTDRGLQFSLLYNVIGQRIFIIGFDAYPDIYEMPRNMLDATATVRLTKKFDLRLAVGDIFNQANVLLQDANDDGVFDRNNDQIIQSFRPGRTYTAGLSYRLNRAPKE
ncbi:MAG: TonB-dependent receptor [Flavobacteriales bacterium]